MISKVSKKIKKDTNLKKQGLVMLYMNRQKNLTVEKY